MIERFLVKEKCCEDSGDFIMQFEIQSRSLDLSKNKKFWRTVEKFHEGLLKREFCSWEYCYNKLLLQVAENGIITTLKKLN